MDIAELRNRLASIAAEIAEQEEVQQEDIAIEEEQVEEVDAPVAEEEFAEEDNLEVAEEEVAEEEVEETVEIPVAELDAIMKLAGFDGYKKVEEYANEPEEQYMDAEDQLIGLSGGLNGPKKMYPAAAGGDNPMDQEPREIEEGVQSIAEFENELYKSYKSFLEENEIKEDNADDVLKNFSRDRSKYKLKNIDPGAIIDPEDIKNDPRYKNFKLPRGMDVKDLQRGKDVDPGAILDPKIDPNAKLPFKTPDGRDIFVKDIKPAPMPRF